MADSVQDGLGLSPRKRISPVALVSRPLPRRLTVVLLVIVGWLAAACGGSNDPVVGSPIDEHLGFAAMEPPDPSTEIDQWREIENLTAACMSERGFEYVPTTAEVEAFHSDPLTDGVSRYERDWIELYGFGISTLAVPQSVLPSSLIGSPKQITSPDSNPNIEIYEQLTESEQEAYARALSGERPNWTTPPTPEQLTAFYDEREDVGCRGDATDEVQQRVIRDAFLSEFATDLDELGERIRADPEWVEWEAAVNKCMADQGHQWRNEPVEAQRISREVATIIGGIPEEGPAGISLTPEQLSALADLQRAEISAAVALDDCGGDQLDRRAMYNQVRQSHEADFLANNQERLAQFTIDS